MDVNEFSGRRTLITGDVNTGKTRYCLAILHAFLKAGMSDIAVLDFAPAPVSGIGGKLVPPETAGVLYFSAAISAPRLTGRNETEIMDLARCNARIIESLLRDYLAAPRDILFINDVTLYLHAGDIERIIRVMDTSTTAVLNAYYGRAFEGMPLSVQEKHRIELLMKRMDHIVSI